MNKKRLVSMILIISGIFITFSIYNHTSADGAAVQPGSVDDPMVSKSYVDEQVKQQVAAQITTQVAAAVEKFKKELPASSGGGGAAGLAVVQLAAGQTLLAGAGSELIVRTGFVKAVSTDGNGIPDVTGGKDIAVNSAIALNHLLIFPTDKRGIKPDPNKNIPIFVMVRGGYKLINADGTESASTAEVPVPAATASPAPSAVVNPAPVVSP